MYLFLLVGKLLRNLFCSVWVRARGKMFLACTGLRISLCGSGLICFRLFIPHQQSHQENCSNLESCFSLLLFPAIIFVQVKFPQAGRPVLQGYHQPEVKQEWKHVWI